MNKKAKQIICSDIFRYYGGNKISLKQKLLLPLELKYIIRLRKIQFTKMKLFSFYHKYQLMKLSQKTMIQIPTKVKIGKGFYIGHCGRIIINSKVEIGSNVNLSTGVVIGQTNRGDKKGVPKIGNNVWIGSNAVIVGKINIGDDVLIAPNSFVNNDVPSHSIVVGNPAKIIPNENATLGYINNISL